MRVPRQTGDRVGDNSNRKDPPGLNEEQRPSPESPKAGDLLAAPVEVFTQTLPPVTVLITAYRRTKFLPDAIESVRAQIYPAPIEILVVDDGSPTPLEPIFATRYPEVKWIRQTNQGVSAARDRGTHAAQHEFIAHLDDDDLCDPKRLQIQAEFLIDHPEVDFVCSDLRHNNEDPMEPGFFMRRGFHQIESLRNQCWSNGAWIYPRHVLAESIFRQLPFFPSTLMARKKSSLRIGSWNPAARLSGDCHDYFLRANHFGILAFLEIPLTILRRGHEDHLTSHPSEFRIHEALQLCALVEDYPRDLQQNIRPAFARYLARTAHACYHNGNKEIACLLYSRASKYAPGINLGRLKWTIAAAGLTLANLIHGRKNLPAIEADILHHHRSTKL